MPLVLQFINGSISSSFSSCCHSSVSCISSPSLHFLPMKLPPPGCKSVIFDERIIQWVLQEEYAGYFVASGSNLMLSLPAKAQCSVQLAALVESDRKQEYTVHQSKHQQFWKHQIDDILWNRLPWWLVHLPLLSIAELLMLASVADPNRKVMQVAHLAKTFLGRHFPTSNQIATNQQQAGILPFQTNTANDDIDVGNGPKKPQSSSFEERVEFFLTILVEIDRSSQQNEIDDFSSVVAKAVHSGKTSGYTQPGLEDQLRKR